MGNEASVEGIVILGAPRSGTTLLRRLLDAHPSVACGPESYLLSACARFLHEDRFPGNPAIGVVSGLGFLGYESETVLERLREFAFNFFREHARGAGKPRWAEKTAFDIFHLESIERLTSGHVHYLCLRRHGLDVACSLAELVDKTGGYVAEVHDYINRYQMPLEAYARMWIDADSALTQFLARHPHDALEIRYEELVDNPLEQMQRVGQFIGEDWSQHNLALALASKDSVGFGDWKTYRRTRIESSSVNRWQKLSKPTLNHLAGVLNPALQAAGYTAIEQSDAMSEQATKRRLELAMMLQSMKKD